MVHGLLLFVYFNFPIINIMLNRKWDKFQNYLFLYIFHPNTHFQKKYRKTYIWYGYLLYISYEYSIVPKANEARVAIQTQ